MTLSLQPSLSSRDVKTLLFQPVTVGGEPSYLVYLAPEGENDGRFVQEEGGVVWCSVSHPDGVPCEGQLISKALGDEILNKNDPESSQKAREIERL